MRPRDCCYRVGSERLDDVAGDHRNGRMGAVRVTVRQTAALSAIVDRPLHSRLVQGGRGGLDRRRARSRLNAGATGCAFDAPSPGISAGVACGTPHTPRPAEAATIRRERSQAGPLRRAAVSRTGRGPGGPSAQGRRSASWDREDVALEATPVALVRSEVAASPAARSVGLEGMELRPSPRGDLQHLAAIEVARVDDEGDAWVALEQLSEP